MVVNRVQVHGTSDDSFCAGVNKKDLYPRHENTVDKGLACDIYRSRSEPFGCVDEPRINHVSG
jgi:hypothetical protein